MIERKRINDDFVLDGAAKIEAQKVINGICKTIDCGFHCNGRFDCSRIKDKFYEKRRSNETNGPSWPPYEWPPGCKDPYLD